MKKFFVIITLEKGLSIREYVKAEDYSQAVKKVFEFRKDSLIYDVIEWEDTTTGEIISDPIEYDVNEIIVKEVPEMKFCKII